MAKPPPRSKFRTSSSRPPQKGPAQSREKYKGKAPNKFQGKPKPKPAPSSTPTPKRAPSGKGYSARPVLRINLANLKENYRQLDLKVGRARIGASVKADAYGLGMVRVARALYGAGCRTFFVANTLEGRDLRQAVGENASIYVLCGPAPRDLTHYFASTLKPVINSLPQARLWAQNASAAKHAPFCALHFDTGMNRLGLSAHEAETLLSDKSIYNALGVDLLMSHLACAPDAAHPLNAKQLDRFNTLVRRYPVLPQSLANTAGIYLGKAYHFNLVRPGIGLYGGTATTNPGQEKSRPVVTLDVPVLQVRSVKSGESVGYDATYTAEQDMEIAILGAGYGDGIPVAASSGQHTLNHAVILGQNAPIIGRVSMDLTIVDVTKIRGDVNPGTSAEFFGEHLSDDAKAAGTINYELLTRLGTRYWREYN